MFPFWVTVSAKQGQPFLKKSEAKNSEAEITVRQTDFDIYLTISDYFSFLVKEVLIAQSKSDDSEKVQILLRTACHRE